MSSALSSPFQNDHIAEVVPDYAKVAGKLSQSSVITGRRRVRLVPQSGQNYGSGNSAGVVNILIQDGQAYADLLSATLSFNLTTTAGVAPAGTLATSVVLDDGAWSAFRRCLVSVNSTLMDDTDFVAKKCNAEIYATASQDWYNGVGSFCGLWKYNTTALGFTPASTDTLISKYNVGARIPLQSLKVQSLATGASGLYPTQTGQNKFSIPVSLLSSFFRNDVLFPARNAGQLYLQLNIANALEALYCGSSQTPANCGFNITNLTLELDYVDLHPTYLAMMDDIIEAPAGSGVQWKFDAHMSATQSLSASVPAIAVVGTTANAGGGGGQQSIIVSKASQNMRSLQVIVQPTAGLSAGTWLPQSTFANPGFVDIQYRIGSLYFPAFTAVGEQRAFFDLQNAFGSPESVDKAGLVDCLNYYLTSWTAGAITTNNNGTPMGTANNTASAVPSTNLKAQWADMWSYAYCFDRLKHATLQGIDLDGINTLTSAGSQMVVQINCNPVETSQMTAFVRFTRVLRLAGGSTQVVG
jgi:hypothetical protein